MTKRKTPWILLSAAALIAYLWQTIRYAISLPIIMDEAAYLYKGFLFVSGQYQPFQAGGPWTNKMPLAFLIPGWVQAVFGEGLRTGRFYAIVVNLLTIIGVWLLVYRLKDIRWAALSVIAFAVTSSVLQSYSQAWSQGIIAMLMVWSLVFVLTPGKKHKAWQLLVGAALAALTVMIRQNLAIYPVLLVAFIFWRDGKKAGWGAFATTAILLVVYHLIYFPEIMRLWLVWLPGPIQGFFAERGFLFTPSSVWQPENSLFSRFDAVWQAVRYHFIFFLGELGTLLLVPWKSYRKPDDRQKAVFFLLASFLGLAAMHFYASVLQDYCVYCFSNYLDFFIVLVPPLVALTAGDWKFPQKRFWQALTITGVIGAIAAVLDLPAKSHKALYKLFETPVPRMKDMRIVEGQVPFSQILMNKLPIADFDAYLRFLDRFATVFTIFVVGLVVLVLVFLLRRFVLKKFQPAAIALCLLAGFSFVMAPTVYFTEVVSPNQCGNYIVNMETTGAHLSALIASESEVDWFSTSSMLPLVYVDGITIHPQKLNMPYSKRVSEDEEQLLAFNFYNQAIEDHWLAESDYIIIEEKAYSQYSDVVETLLDWEYQELPPTLPICENDKGSTLHIFQKP